MIAVPHFTDEQTAGLERDHSRAGDVAAIAGGAALVVLGLRSHSPWGIGLSLAGGVLACVGVCHMMRAAGCGRRVSAKEDAAVDEELDQSFPASDPPSWTLGKSTADAEDAVCRV